jgi:hypothetical protein
MSLSRKSVQTFYGIQKLVYRPETGQIIAVRNDHSKFPVATLKGGILTVGQDQPFTNEADKPIPGDGVEIESPGAASQDGETDLTEKSE